jgi:hypothetical protein
MSLLPLAAALALLLVDSAIELALISSMVGYLHRSGANKYPFQSQVVQTIQAKPAGLMVDQGHTSNGAAGTALIPVCFGGFIVMWLQRRRAQQVSLLDMILQLVTTNRIYRSRKIRPNSSSHTPSSPYSPHSSRSQHSHTPLPSQIQQSTIQSTQKL